MLTPISGQSERWAQPATPPSVPETQVAQTASSLPQAVTGVTAAATSNAIDAALIAFASQSAAASAQAPEHAPPAAPVADNAIAGIPSDAVAQLLQNLQLLGTPATFGSSQIDNGVTATPTTAANPTDNPDYPASLLQPAGPVPASPHAGGHFLNGGTATATAIQDIANSTTADASNPVNNPLNDPLGSFMQQVAMAAYASGYASGMESANTSSMTGFNA